MKTDFVLSKTIDSTELPEILSVHGKTIAALTDAGFVMELLPLEESEDSACDTSQMQ